MSRIALGLTYDGSRWQGWQTQPNGLTVQDILEAALARFLDRSVGTICAGRTDTGVHALGQVVHLDTGVERRLESWVRGVNALLPDSVAIQWARSVPDSFHARFSALSRSYVYVVRNARIRSPLMHGRVGWVYHPLDLNRMRDALRRLVGEHDFSSFRSSQCQAASPIRTLQEASIEQQGDFFLFTFRANAFLHHMIRNLMGAILYVGQGRQEPEWIDALLLERDRRRAAPTFSPSGLYLAAVEYPVEYALPSAEVDASVFSLSGLNRAS